MFNEVQRQVVENADKHISTLRFAHAETMIPLAALMKLEGSRQGALPGVLMSQANNEWRGGWVSPYAANIQWDVYRNDTGRVLVKMLYNEKELAFKEGCGSFFYDFNALKRCYGNPSWAPSPGAPDGTGRRWSVRLFLPDHIGSVRRRPPCQVVPIEAAMMAAIPSH